MGGVATRYGRGHKRAWARPKVPIGTLTGCAGWRRLQMLLLYAPARPCVAFLNEWTINHDYLYIDAAAWPRVEGGLRECACVYTCIPHRVSTVFPYVSVSLTSCRKTAACACACGRFCSVRICLWFSHSCSDGNKGVFSVCYTFPPELFVLFTRNALSRIQNIGFCGYDWHLRENKTVYTKQFFEGSGIAQGVSVSLSGHMHLTEIFCMPCRD